MVFRSKRRSSIVLPWEKLSLWRGPNSPLRRLGFLSFLALGLFMLLAVWRSYQNAESARITKNGLLQIRYAALHFRHRTNRCPKNLSEVLTASYSATPRLSYPLLDKWGRTVKMICPGRYRPEDVDVISAGPSGKWSEDDSIQ